MHGKNQLLLEMLTEGTTSISNILLSNYKNIGLTDKEMMIIIHLLYYQGKGNLFPSIHQLEKRMSISNEEIMKSLQRLVRQGYIYINETVDNNGKMSEIYNLTPIYFKLMKEFERVIEVDSIQVQQKKDEKRITNIFKVFEQEFGRPLSPIEIEMMNAWIDKDRYSEEIIFYALKEAVFANKINLRYIDRILFEWQRNKIKTIEQIKDHTKKFRQTKGELKKEQTKDNEIFEPYNWLEEDE